jgi:hypothetical protein
VYFYFEGLIMIYYFEFCSLNPMKSQKELRTVESNFAHNSGAIEVSGRTVNSIFRYYESLIFINDFVNSYLFVSMSMTCILGNNSVPKNMGRNIAIRKSGKTINFRCILVIVFININ